MCLPSTRYLLLCLTIWSSGGLYAQSQQRQDSLLLALKQTTSDSTRIDLYLELHKLLIGQDTSQSMDYINRAIRLITKTSDKKRLCRAYLSLCNYYWKKGRLLNAKDALKKVRKEFSSLNDLKIKATFWMEGGLVYFQEGTYDSAIHCFLNAIPYYQKSKDTLGHAKCYSNMGIVYYEMENFDKALEYHQKGRALQNKNVDDLTISRTLGNIGLVYKAQGNYALALDYYRQSLAINRKNGYHFDTAINLENIASLYSTLKEYNTSLEYYKESYELSKKINDKIGILYAMHGIASTHASLGKYKQSITHLNNALNLATHLYVKEEIKEIHLSLSEVYEKSGSHKMALLHRKKYDTWKDSLVSERHQNRVKELELQYQTAQKDKEITALKSQKEINEMKAKEQVQFTNTLITTTVLITIIATLIIFLLRQRLKVQRVLSVKNEEVKTFQLKQQISELELKALKAQMNPHFVFNCMNSINKMILCGETKDASQYLTKFSGLIRQVLENSERQRITVNDELTLLESYMRLERLRFKDKITHRVEIDPEIDADSTYIPAMVLQPIIENAIWHGLMPKEEGGEITLFVKREDDFLHCSIVDNGIGREASAKNNYKETKGKSLGLELIERRLRMMSKTMREKFVRIEDLKDPFDQAIGTRVNLWIPVA